MSKIRLALVSLSTVAFVLCLGLFSTRAISWASPSTGPAVQTAPATETAPASSSAGDERCTSSATTDETETLVPADSRCGKGFVWTVCRCGGAGCRPQNISPTNWCAC